MTMMTAGIGPSNLILTNGLGNYAAYVIPPVEEGGDTGTGGSKYQVAPRRIFLKVDEKEPALRLSDISPKEIREILNEATEVTLDGDTYLVSAMPMPTPTQALGMLSPDDLERKVEAAKKELGVTKRKAVAALKLRAKKELAAAKKVKERLVEHDNALALIIIFSEV